jgi:CDP-paratose 2-epimerase
MHCDIRNREDLEAISFNPDIVLECSAQTTAVDGYHNPLYDFTNNTLGVVNVLEFCRKKSSGIIFWSSNKAYSGDFCNSIPMTEDDTRFNWDLSRAKEVRGWTKTGFNEEGDLNGGSHTIYGVTKNAADLLIQEWSVAFNIPAVINRFSCLYGPQVRDCLHIDDLHSLISKQSNSIDSHYGDYYNVGGGIENTTSILEFNNLLNELIKGQHKKIKNSESRKADQKIYISDITKVCKDFNWNPQIGIEKGMETVIKWIDDEKEDFSWMKGS